MDQTNKTLLMAEINPDVESILTFIHEIEAKKSLTDENIKTIHERLEVHSFEEFMRKFTPSVYMLLDTDEMDVKFSHKHFGRGEEVIRLDHPDSLFSMLTFLIETKHKKEYVLSGFSEMLHNLIPKATMIPVMNARNEIISLLQKSEFEITTKIKNRMKKFCQNYDDGLLLLMTFLQDSVWYASPENKAKKSDRAIIESDDNLQIEIMKVSDQYGRSHVFMEEEEVRSYEKAFLSLYDQISEKISIRNRVLIQRLFFLPAWLAEKNDDLLINTYQSYSAFYMELIRKFWIASKPLMETLIGVKEFFAQYHGEDGMVPSMVIANFALQDLLQAENRDRFELYLQTVNDKNDISNCIWFAICPHLASERVDRNKIVRERFQSKRTVYSYPTKNEIPEMGLTLELLGRHRVISFLSFEISDAITFSGYAEVGYDWVADQLRPFDKMDVKDYIVPCYPNFVVVSKEEACMNMGEAIEYDSFSGDIRIAKEKNIWLDEVGIEASFVAAGMIAASQCPTHLSKYFRQRFINEKLPGIAFRFSEDEHYKLVTSNMISDSVNYSQELLEDGIRNSKGIFFGQLDGKVMLLTDRTFAYGYGNQMLVSMVQTATYIERVARIETQDFKKNLIKQFFQRRPDSMIEKWNLDETRYINSFLKENETLHYSIDEDDGTCTISINFANHGYVRDEIFSMFKE